MLRSILAFAVLPLIASCVGPREAQPEIIAPPPVIRPIAPPSVGTVVDRYAGDWSVADIDAGDWSYVRDGAASVARLSGDGAAMLRCDAGQITLARSGVVITGVQVAINVRTSFAERQLPVRSPDASGRMLSATLPPSDPLWDQIIYSRGRFVIEATGNAPMIVPVRAELARVVEDCRG